MLPVCCCGRLFFCSGRAHIPVDTYQANLQTIVQKLLSNGVERVMLATPTPYYEGAAQALPSGEVSKGCVDVGGGGEGGGAKRMLHKMEGRRRGEGGAERSVQRCLLASFMGPSGQGKGGGCGRRSCCQVGWSE